MPSRQPPVVDSTLRVLATAVFRAAVEAVDPERLVFQSLKRSADSVFVVDESKPSFAWQSPTLVVGAGKAAAGMATACERVLGDACSGEVIVAAGGSRVLSKIRVTEGGHPLPDERGHAAARRILDLVEAQREGGILCLISGGASSLLVLPCPPITLADKVRVNKLMLESGADIQELNCVRKHLSLIKGGGLLAAARVPIATLILSDVVGDDPAVIGSGPTTVDTTTYADAEEVVRKFDLWERLPDSVRGVLAEGRQRELANLAEADQGAAGRGFNLVLASNRTALRAAAEAARRLGWEVEILAEPLVGDTTVAARRFADQLVPRARSSRNRCVLAGGETTVRVVGSGRGGRNQEFAVALAAPLAGLPVLVLSAGTDGIDGPTDAAGGFVDGSSESRAESIGLSAPTALEKNDSYTFLEKVGDHFRCGPTGTNVMDIKIAFLPARN